VEAGVHARFVVPAAAKESVSSAPAGADSGICYFFPRVASAFGGLHPWLQSLAPAGAYAKHVPRYDGRVPRRTWATLDTAQIENGTRQTTGPLRRTRATRDVCHAERLPPWAWAALDIVKPANGDRLITGLLRQTRATLDYAWIANRVRQDHGSAAADPCHPGPGPGWIGATSIACGSDAGSCYFSKLSG
jgi:hypothetical protein